MDPLTDLMETCTANGLPVQYLAIVKRSALECYEGQQIYFPKGAEIRARNILMISQFNGRNMQALCLEYKISRSRFRYILRMSQRAKIFHPIK